MSDELRFGRIEARPALRQLRVDGKPVVIGLRALDVMMALVERRDRLVSKKELVDASGVAVEENNLYLSLMVEKRPRNGAICGSQATPQLNRSAAFSQPIAADPFDP